MNGVINDISENCDVCKRYRRTPPRPVVSFPLATEFNETVAMDIKFINTRPFLHLIDHATRYSRASLIPNKKPETVIREILMNWIQIFGQPRQFLTDNGGEFVNKEMLELAEKFSIVMKTTAAESAWSNGLCERHNGIIADMVAKIQADCRCTLELALSWATSAKNAMSSTYGFSPNQLVFGQNVRLPDVHNDKLSAHNESCSSALIANHLIALHKARQAFVAQESCEKLRRALNKQTRTYSNTQFLNGDNVYYKRQQNAEWHGPAKVLGRDGSQYLLKHGGHYIRVHPCRLQLVNPMNQDLHTENTSSEHKVAQVDPEVQYEDGGPDSDAEYPDTLQQVIIPPSPPATPRTPGHIQEAPRQRLQLNIEPSPTQDRDQSAEIDTIHNHMSSTRSSGAEDITTRIPRALSRLADFNKPSSSQDVDSKESLPSLSNEIIGGNEIEDVDATHVTTTVVKAPRDLPKPLLNIKYRFHDDGVWHHGEVVSKAGKATTANWHYMNIKETDQSAKCISLKNAEWTTDQKNDQNGDVEEVFFGTSTESHRFNGPKNEEIQKWKEFNTFTEVDDTGQPRISTTWVCTEKMKGGKLVLKARLVARGFEEDKSQLRTDSPTCSKESLRMLLCILAAKRWKLCSIDIKSAYLQGNDISRDIYLQPPKCANTTKLWKLNKTPYGLVDAGRQWYIRVVKEFTALGAHQAKCDRAVFIWSNPDNDGPCGILTSHVDDFLYGGNSQFQNKILPKIREIFQIGLEESDSMRYLGLDISHVDHGISLTLEKYGNSLSEIDTSICGTDKKKDLNKDEASQFKRVVGQINWVATQSRPDVSFDNCILGNSASKATVGDIYQANKVLRRIRGFPVTLFFPTSLDLGSCRIVCFTDASFANLPDRGSQGGYIMFIVDMEGIYAPLAWQSKRIKRVVNSSLSSECLEAVEAAETCILLRERLQEMLCLKQGSVKISLLTDSKSLLDAVHTSTSVENKRLQIDINMLREMVERNEINEFRWIPTEYQLANPLTKSGASVDYLVRTIRCSQGLRYQHNSGQFV